jgi:hypothetical protein
MYMWNFVKDLILKKIKSGKNLINRDEESIRRNHELNNLKFGEKNKSHLRRRRKLNIKNLFETKIYIFNTKENKHIKRKKMSRMK